MARGRRPWSLLTRLSIALFLLFVPIFVAVVVTYLENLEERRNTAVANLEALDHTVAASLNSFARDMETFAESASVTLAAAAEAGVSLDQPTFGTYFRDLARSYNVRSIFLTDLEGRVIAGTTGNVGFDVSSRGYFAALRDGAEKVWSGALAGQLTGQTTLAFGRVVKSTRGEPLAYLFIAFYPPQLASRLPRELAPDTNVTLIDNNGVVLISTLRGGPETPTFEISSAPEYQRAAAGETVLVRDKPTPVDDGKRYGAFAPVETTGWVVGLTRPSSAIEGPLNSDFVRSLLIVAVTFAAALAAAVVIAARLSTPLRRLASWAAQIERGEQPATLPRADDRDVLVLQGALENMSRAIATREKDLRFLAESTALLSESLDYEQTLARLARVLVPDVGDWCAVHLEEDGELKPVAIAHEDPARIAWARELYERYPVQLNDQRGVYRVFRTGEPELVERIPDDLLAEAALDEEHLALLRAVGFTSYISVPLRSREGIVGTITLVTAESRRSYTTLDLALLEELGSRAGLAVGHARLYRESQQARDELARANEAKDEFLGIVSHELRTPTTTIFGGARLLNDPSRDLPAEARAELLHNIEAEADKMVHLIENLLLLARVEMGREPERAEIVIDNLVQEACEDLQRSHPDRDVRVDNRLAGRLIRSDQTSLRQVLYNLLSNAAKYAPPQLPIEVRVEERGSAAEFHVLDRGPGVKPEELALIFESFYRSPGVAKKAPGKGIGLAVCRRLVESLGGEIKAEGRPGGGLDVWFRVPLAPAGEPADELPRTEGAVVA
ncbi:MAG TPA: ATP-binding protein [Dehalococcoidia bacterium]|nr:ATP-binding protein [Dehalococcoidia bacterium]